MPAIQLRMSLGRILLGAGFLLILTAILFLGLERFGLRPGRLPGDMTWQGRNWQLSIPLATSILVSAVLTVLLWIASRIAR